MALQIAGTVNLVFLKGVDRVDDKGLGREESVLHNWRREAEPVHAQFEGVGARKRRGPA